MAEANPAGGDEVRNIAHAFLDAWNRNDIQAVKDLFHANITFKNPLLNGPISGAAVHKFVDANRAAFPDEKAEVIGQVLLGSNLAGVQTRVTGTWTGSMAAGPFAGMKPTGKSFSVESANFIEIQEGKVAFWTQYFDPLVLLKQIGVTA